MPAQFAQGLRAIRGTAAPPLPYKYTGTACLKKDPLVWSYCKTPTHTASHVAQANWRPVKDMDNHVLKADLEPLAGSESLAAHGGERAGRKPLVSSHRNIEPGVDSIGDAGSTRPG